LEERTTGTYKPSSQVRFLVEKMLQPEQTLLDSIAKLTEHMSSMEKTMDMFSRDLGAIHTKVDLAITSINPVQQEQVQVAKLMKAGSVGFAASATEGVMEPSPLAGWLLPRLDLLHHPCHPLHSCGLR
jgi:hypothetical protein